jgi:hypothetical protein
MRSSNQQPNRHNFALISKLSTTPPYFCSKAIWSLEWGIHKKELRNSQGSFKSSTDCLERYSDELEKTRYIYTHRILTQNLLETVIRNTRNEQEDNIKNILMEICCEDLRWIEVHQYYIQCWAKFGFHYQSVTASPSPDHYHVSQSLMLHFEYYYLKCAFRVY